MKRGLQKYVRKKVLVCISAYNEQSEARTLNGIYLLNVTCRCLNEMRKFLQRFTQKCMKNVFNIETS